MNKAIAAICVGLLLAAAAGPASARTKHRRPDSPTATQSHIDSGWGPPRTWDEIEISHPEGGGF
jgi:hypothetical protein